MCLPGCDDLSSLIKDLGIVDFETGLPPVSSEELNVIKIQLLAAKVIVTDLMSIESSHLCGKSLLDKLLQNWTDNIRDFVNAMIKLEKYSSKDLCGEIDTTKSK